MNLTLEIAKLKDKYDNLLEITQVPFQYTGKIGLWPTKTIKICLYIKDKKHKIRKVEIIERYIKDNLIDFTMFMENKEEIISVYVDKETYGLRTKREVMRSNIYYSFKKGYTLKNIEYLREGR